MDHRIGLIALDSDATTEPDFCRMLPPGVVFYTTRIRHINPVSVENLRKQGPQLAEAAALLIPGQPLDVIAYSCTSATAALGFTEVAEQIRAGGRADVPVVTPLTAALAAFELLRVRSISLLTPHPDEVNRSSVEFFESNGIEVVNVETFDMDDDIAIANLTPDMIYERALTSFHRDAQAMFISSTALRAVEIVERAENGSGKPVLTAVQCLFWEALRRCGHNKPVRVSEKFYITWTVARPGLTSPEIPKGEQKRYRRISG